MYTYNKCTIFLNGTLNDSWIRSYLNFLQICTVLFCIDIYCKTKRNACLKYTSVSYCMVCGSVREDYPRALAIKGACTGRLSTSFSNKRCNNVVII